MNGFKQRFRRSLEPIARTLVRAGLTAHDVTVLGALLTCGAGVALLWCETRIALVLLIVGGSCDFLDGAIARASNSVTRFGAFLDSTLDRYGETFLYVGLTGCFVRHGAVGAVVAAALALSGSLLVSYARARAEAVGYPCDEGFAQRPERLVLLGVGLLFGGTVLVGAVWVVAVVSHATVVQRMVIVARRAREEVR